MYTAVVISVSLTETMVVISAEITVVVLLALAIIAVVTLGEITGSIQNYNR